MFVLIITWLVLNQPPASTQTTFSTMAKCEVARQAVLTQQSGIEADFARQIAERRQMGQAYNPGPVPQVSAICAAR